MSRKGCGGQLNTGEQLGRFLPPAASFPCEARILERARLTFRTLEGNGSGMVGELARYVLAFLKATPPRMVIERNRVTFPHAEAERADMLARVNARTGGRWEGSDAALLILTRRQLGKEFRVWRSASRPRAVPRWETGDRFPVLSRFRKLPGLFPLAADLPKLGKVAAEGENAAGAYLEQLGAATLNRVRASSPRWRGTARHKRRRSRAAQTFTFTLKARREVQYQADWEQQERLSAARIRRQTRGKVFGSTPAKFVETYLELYKTAKEMRSDRALWMVRRTFCRRVSAAVKTDMNWLREMLRLLREAQAERDTYAGFIGLMHAEAFRLYLLELSAEQRQDAEPPPRPPDLQPLPPAAPLAPPA